MNKRFRITEKQRTVVLVLLLMLAVGFLLWTRQQYDANFIEAF
jgi:hypothetical protein